VQAQQAATSLDHSAPNTAKTAAVARDTLVLYIYNEDDPIFRDNFEYFLLAGVQENSRCGLVKSASSNFPKYSCLLQCFDFHTSPAVTDVAYGLDVCQALQHTAHRTIAPNQPQQQQQQVPRAAIHLLYLPNLLN
jgi:hypothetical protein